AAAGEDHQARRWLPAHAADPWWARGPTIRRDAATSRETTRPASGLGVGAAATPRPQQGGRGPGQQAGAEAMGHRPPRCRIQPRPRQRQTQSRLRANGNCQECTTISIMTKGSVPGWGKADNNSGSRSRLNDRPPPADFMMARAHRAHPKAEYTTATDPLPKVRDQSVRCLQGESIHALLGAAIVAPLLLMFSHQLKLLVDGAKRIANLLNRSSVRTFECINDRLAGARARRHAAQMCDGKNE